MLASLATFAIAFVARPIGSALFGHFGDRIGRKRTLVLALLTMGISTFVIGTLPSYRTIGIGGAGAAGAVPVRAGNRAGRRMGRRGAAGGGKCSADRSARCTGCFRSWERRWDSFFRAGYFSLLSRWLTDAQFFAFGWRLPFLASAVLVLLGLYVRLTITETPVFEAR